MSQYRLITKTEAIKLIFENKDNKQDYEVMCKRWGINDPETANDYAAIYANDFNNEAEALECLADYDEYAFQVWIK